MYELRVQSTLNFVRFYTISDLTNQEEIPNETIVMVNLAAHPPRYMRNVQVYL